MARLKKFRSFRNILALCVLAVALNACETLESTYSSVADAVSAPFSSEPRFGDGASSIVLDAREKEAAVKWDRLKDSTDQDVLRRFSEDYRDTVFSGVAQKRIAELKREASAPSSRTAYFDGSTEPAPPASPASGGLPDPVPAGQFPAPWLLGNWAINCAVEAPGNRVTYVLDDKDRVTVQRDNGTEATYTVSRQGNLLTLAGNGLVYKDKIISVDLLRSYAVRQGNIWHSVDLTYEKCG